MKSKLRKQFDLLVSQYVEAFEKKHDVHLDFWVADDVGGIGMFGDYYLAFDDIRTDINCRAKKDLIFQWHDENLEAGIKNSINYKSFIMGLRVKQIKKK